MPLRTAEAVPRVVQLLAEVGSYSTPAVTNTGAAGLTLRVKLPSPAVIATGEVGSAWT
ncbi:MAG: hypothetical protein HC897_02055, partial [Thermoanaerobaculia bacterium]|nr:hypothetical protein [Thermoanaerobaculia bacterium]